MTLDAGSDHRHARRRLFAVVALILSTAILTAGIVAYAWARIAQNQQQFQATQALRLSLASKSVEDVFGDSVQLVNAIADTLGGVRNDRPLAEQLLRGLLRARSMPQIYGMGAFYAPGVFDDKTRLFGPYDIAGAHPHEDVTTERTYVYPDLFWYKDAIAAHGHVIFDGPYKEKNDPVWYISAVKAFYDGRKVAGVATVDIQKGTFLLLLTSAISRDDIAYVQIRDGTIELSTAPVPTDSIRLDRSQPIRYTAATLHLLTDTKALKAANGRVALETTVAVVAMWLLATLLAVAMIRSWSARDAALALEGQKTRLQRELDVRKQIENELRHAAYTDALTGLPNRTPFLEAVSHAIASLNGNGTAPRSVFFIDVDRFNAVNDTLGHLAGDELLKIVAERLRACVGPDGMVARLGGDEFIVLVPIEDGVRRCAQQLLDAFKEPVALGERALYIGASIGAAVIDAHYGSAEDVLRDADIAMFAAKHAGRGRFAVFDGSMGKRIARESALENSLRHAIEHDEFATYYQPVVALPAQRIASFEALIRWNRNDQTVEAGDFIGFAESRGLIGAIDALVRGQVWRDAPALFARFPDASIAINLSADELTSQSLVPGVSEILRSGFPASRLKFEITETAIMTDAVHAQATVERLRDLGVEIVLDDFGQGHSSLAYLRRLPIAGVKIDRAFITPLGTDLAATAIVRSVVALAQTLELYTVAEGVETAAQLAAVNEIGVTFAQGFLFAPALSLAAMLETAACLGR